MDRIGHQLNQVRGNIYSAVIRSIKQSGNRDEEDWNIHASEISTFCPRKYLLCKKYNIPFHAKRSEYMPLGTAVTFQIGQAMEEFFVRSMKANSNITTLFAYKCPKCGEIYHLTNTQAKKCPKCKTNLEKRQMHLQYEVIDNVYINGHPDLIMKMGSISPKFFIYELKSIKPDEFDILTKPLLAHEYQIKTYLWLVSKLKKYHKQKYGIDSSLGYVVYIKKTYDRDPIKIYPVDLDDRFKNEIEDAVAQLRGEKPAERICNSINSLMARDCPVAKYCFA